jgi:hypothetical protein
MRLVTPNPLPRSLRRLPAIALLALLTASAPTFAATLYVDDLNDGQVGTGTSANPYRNLQTAINAAASGDTIVIRPGRYIAAPAAFTDPTCGNCDAATFRQNIPATRGFRIANKSLILLGDSRTGTILETRAGYGVLFESAGTSRIENLTITGGVRDADGRATNGAVVVRSTTLTVRNADLVNNNNLYTGTPDPVVGISGIVGREGSVITAENLLIQNNGWDGIALYRGDPAIANSGARATVNNVTIDQGRGVGIGVTWDAQADITNARISNYWKGVGSFGSSRVTLRNSILRDQLGWGVTADGTSNMTAVNNVVTRQGRFALGQFSANATVTFTNNIAYDNGWNLDYNVGPRAGIWLNNTSLATVTYNDSFGNQLQNFCAGGSCTALNLAGVNGNISANPLFVNAAGNNFALQCGSPAINAGSPSILDTDGTRSDMGAYGGPSSPQAPPSCGRADLLPTAITYTPASPEAGNVINFDSGVRNAGLTGTGSFNVKWFIDGVQIGYGGHTGVPANTTILNGNSALSWTATQGTHTITFTVDTDNHVSESNEGNNSTSITVVVAPPRPDLTPTAITYNSADLVRGRQVLFDSGVQNLKNVASGSFNIKWFVDGVQVGYGGHVGVAGNSTVLNGNSAFTWTAVAGTHTLTFSLDVDNHVAESNEGNNSRSVTVTVP